MADFDASRIQVLAFDIFGTTVDWYTGVSDQLAELPIRTDPRRLATEWRGRYVPSMQRVQSGERAWANLDQLHRESLDELLAQFGEDLAEPQREVAVRAWHRLPPWPDTVAGLARLRTRFVLAALSNGGFALLTHLAKSGRLPFDCILSAELARAYKPDPRAYRLAPDLLAVPPSAVLMVAAHTWDLDGARAAGLRTAFVDRPAEKGPDHPADSAADTTADLYAASFTDLADQLGC